MSGHAETLEAYVKRVLIDADARAAALAVLAENQRYEKALERIDAYIASLAYPGPEAKRIAEAVREALAGDAE